MADSTAAYSIRLGDSFQPTRSPHSRSLHTIRYNFEPDSVDKSRGTLQEDGKGEVTLSLAHATQSIEEHVFKGQQATAKESEFLLMFDEETGEYVLEKLSSTFTMRNIRQAKRPHAAISNLEDANDGKTSSKIVGSATTAGLLKPPVNFTAKLSPPSSPRSTGSSSSREFSDLEDLLVRELSNESC